MDDYSKSVTFGMSDVDSSYSVQKSYEDGTTWPVILQDFITFLESTGYFGVKSRVSVEDSPFLDQRWDGPVHSNDKDDWK